MGPEWRAETGARKLAAESGHMVSVGASYFRAPEVASDFRAPFAHRLRRELGTFPRARSLPAGEAVADSVSLN